MIKNIFSLILFLPTCLASIAMAQSSERFIEGPITATVVEVIDGDTMKVVLHPWLYTQVSTRVRLNRIDTPEVNSKKPECQGANALGAQATEFVKQLLQLDQANRVDESDEEYENQLSASITISNVRPGKYSGRVIAEAFTSNGENISDLLLAQGLAKQYNGGKRPNWCV